MAAGMLEAGRGWVLKMREEVAAAANTDVQSGTVMLEDHAEQTAQTSPVPEPEQELNIEELEPKIIVEQQPELELEPLL